MERTATMGGSEALFLADIKVKLLARINPRTNAPIAASTADSYIRYVTNLYKKVGAGGRMSSLKWTDDTDAVMKMLRESYAPSSQTTALNALSAVLAVFPRKTKQHEFYYALMRQGLDTETAARASPEKTETQEEYWMDWKDVIAKRDSLPMGVDKVILSLYTMIPPGRVQEYATMKVDGDPVGNVYDTRKQEFHIRQHKTAKSTGDVVVKVPDDLRDVLMAWLDGRKDGLLLGGLTAPSITKHLNRVLGKKVGPSALRHIYLAKYGAVTTEMKADAAAMRHSTATQASYIKV